MRLSIMVRGVDAVARRMELRTRRLHAELGKATVKASRMVAKVIRKRLYVARSISQQDASKPRKLTGANPVRMQVNLRDAEGIITIRRHYARVRLPQSGGSGLRPALVRILGDGEYTRKSLMIRRPKGRAARSLYAEGKNDYSGRQPLKRFNLRRHAWLKRWAEREDKGKQIHRHVLYLRKPEVLRELAAAPAILETRQIVINIYRDAAVKGLLG